MTRLAVVVAAACVAVVVAAPIVAVLVAVLGAVAVALADEELGGDGLFVFVFVVGLALLAVLRFLGDNVGFLGDTLLGVLGDVVVGVVAGVVVVVVVVVVVGLLLLVIVSVVVEVGQRRGAQVPAYLCAVSPLAPRTLRWVRGLLPGDEGAAWLAEVTSCLSEARDKSERRRYFRSYRRKVPQLIWTSWALHLGGSRSRTLS